MQPQFSPDGSRIAFASDRGGDWEIWLAAADGSRPVQLTQGLLGIPFWPRWSPDGRSIAFGCAGEDGKVHIWVIEAGGGRPRQVSPGASNELWPSWSRDGQWLNYCSELTGRQEIWRIPVAGGKARQITDDGGRASAESTDGKTLFYKKTFTSPLFARSLQGGGERQVLKATAQGGFAVFEDGIYYVGPLHAEVTGWSQGPTAETGWTLNPRETVAIQFYAFSTRTSSLVAKLDKEVTFAYVLSVGPDRKTFLFDASKEPVFDLVMIEDFR